MSVCHIWLCSSAAKRTWEDFGRGRFDQPSPVQPTTNRRSRNRYIVITLQVPTDRFCAGVEPRSPLPIAQKTWIGYITNSTASAPKMWD